MQTPLVPTCAGWAIEDDTSWGSDVHPSTEGWVLDWHEDHLLECGQMVVHPTHVIKRDRAIHLQGA